MNKAKALKVLEEVRTFVGDHDVNYGPKLMDHNHEGLRRGSWSICYEGGYDNWATHFATKTPGIFVEPILSCILGVYDA